MDTSDYRNRLAKALKNFGQEDRDAILTEIQSHMDSGEEDPTLGTSPEERQARLQTELGSPEQMGMNMQQVHRSNRWLDFLLVAIPVYVGAAVIELGLIFLNGSSVWDEKQYLTWSIRAIILLGIAMMAVSYHRRSLLMIAFWVPDVIARLITLMTREQRWVPGLQAIGESLMWYFVLGGLLYLLAKFLMANRHDWLLIVFAIQPLLGSLLGLLTLQIGAYPLYPSWFMSGYRLVWLVEIASLAGVFLLLRRDLRWLAFFIGISKTTFLMSASYWHNPWVVLFWAGEAVFVMAAWFYDWRKRHPSQPNLIV